MGPTLHTEAVGDATGVAAGVVAAVTAGVAAAVELDEEVGDVPSCAWHLTKHAAQHPRRSKLIFTELLQTTVIKCSFQMGLCGNADIPLVATQVFLWPEGHGVE